MRPFNGYKGWMIPTIILCDWYLALQPFSFIVSYRKGWEHANADFFLPTSHECVFRPAGCNGWGVWCDTPNPNKGGGTNPGACLTPGPMARKGRKGQADDLKGWSLLLEDRELMHQLFACFRGIPLFGSGKPVTHTLPERCCSLSTYGEYWRKGRGGNTWGGAERRGMKADHPDERGRAVYINKQEFAVFSLTWLNWISYYLHRKARVAIERPLGLLPVEEDMPEQGPAGCRSIPLDF